MVFFARVCWQYSRYSSSGAACEPGAAAAATAAAGTTVIVAEMHPAKPKTTRLGSFKELMQFVDKKEEEVKKIMKRRWSEKDGRVAGTSDSSA
jgi:ionotropic glutamate receptor